MNLEGPVRTKLSPAAMECRNSFCNKKFAACSDCPKSVKMPRHTEITTCCLFMQFVATLPYMVASFSLDLIRTPARMLVNNSWMCHTAVRHGPAAPQLAFPALH